MGCLNYIGNFYSKIAKDRQELQNLLKKNMEFNWTARHTSLIKAIKQNCKKLPALKLPEAGKLFILQTDASDKYWAAVLIQKNTQGEEEVCAYTSGTFSGSSLNYTIYEKEILAVQKGIMRFRIYLLPEKFLVRTDNKMFKAFLNKKIDK